MLAKEIMSKKPDVLSPKATIKEAAELMRDHDYGFIPIGENDRLIGAITDRDIAIRAVADGKDVTETTVKEVMSDKIQYCYEEDDVEEVGRKMKDLQLRRLVVLNDKKRLVGIISLGDLATRSEDQEFSGEITEAVSQH